MKSNNRIALAIALSGLLGAFFIALFGCATTPPTKPTQVEKVSYAELADPAKMKENDNRLVSVEIEYLGPDAALMPLQALYSGTDIGKLIMINHCTKGFDYSKQQVSSLDSFLVGLPNNDQYSDLVGKDLKVGETLQVEGYTKFINAGFGTFQHLLLEVRELKRIS